MTTHPIIQFSHASFSYNGRVALEDLTLDLHEGEFVGVIGPNGSGKTTLLKALLGLIHPVSGALQIFDCACQALRCEHRARIGYLPQKEKVDPNYPITNLEVVMMGRYGALGLMKRPGKKDREIVLDALDAVDMADRKDRPFGHLSGGEQQRVLIARALAQRPEILLLDEPTTGIDAPTQSRLVELIQKVHKDYHLTIVLVTHDINMISGIAETILLLKTKLHALGPPAEILTKQVLSPVYGEEVIVAKRNQQPYIIIHDEHHHA
ncbi:MAG: metal ABC transporter ATP-binding protein [Nitrospirae bacterium]|nr:metal ABC transporter ATP-binding protein [Candidatus Manganitrophaceae bacterium]